MGPAYPAATAIIRCCAISTGPARRPPGSCGRGTPARTPPPTTRPCWISRLQLDKEALDGEILIRADGAGATHELTTYCREAELLFSFGFDLSEPVREAIVAVPEALWINAIRVDGSERDHSHVVEITDRVDLSAWAARSRLIARRTKLKD